MSGLATLTLGMPASWVGSGPKGEASGRVSRATNRYVVMQVTSARISGHRPRPAGRRTIPSTTAQQRREAKVASFNLLGPDWRNEPFPVGKPESKFRWAFALLPGEDLTTLLYPISLPANGSVFSPVRPDQALGWFVSSKLWEVNSLIDSRAPGNFCTLSRGQRNHSRP